MGAFLWRSAPIAQLDRAADFGFELALASAEEAFDQTARCRVAGRPVKQFDVETVTGGLQRVSVIDFGVVEVQLAADSMHRPATQQRIDQDVEVLGQVVAAADKIAAMAVDEARQVGANGSFLLRIEHIGAFLEVAQPQSVGLLAGPTATDLGLGDAQLDARGAGLSEMPVEGAFGEGCAETQLGHRAYDDRRTREANQLQPSRSAPHVPMVQATDLRDRNDLTFGRRFDVTWDRRVAIQG